MRTSGCRASGPLPSARGSASHGSPVNPAATSNPSRRGPMRALRRLQRPVQLTGNRFRQERLTQQPGRPVQRRAGHRTAPAPFPANFIHSLRKARAHPAVTCGHIHSEAGQTHPFRGHGKHQFGRGRQRQPRNRDLGDPAEEGSQVLSADYLPGVRHPAPAARTDRGPAGSPTRTATGSNWSSGRPSTPAASPRSTSPEQPAQPWHNHQPGSRSPNIYELAPF
jgi:hypothetical protein